MVERTFTQNKYNEYAGTSLDDKPTVGVGTGSIFVEVDTGLVFFFNEAASEWVEQFSFQSGGSGAKSLTKSAPEDNEEPKEEQPEER